MSKYLNPARGSDARLVGDWGLNGRENKFNLNANLPFARGAQLPSMADMRKDLDHLPQAKQR
ncbi:MAG TPA: hypothetical protein PKY73_19940, partial [Hyphomonas sp.]|nr:hypothetical protein [Hyphomonas sp.]